MKNNLLLLAVYGFNIGSFTQIALRDPELQRLAICFVLVFVPLAIKKAKVILGEFNRLQQFNSWDAIVARHELEQAEAMNQAVVTLCREPDKNVSVGKED